MAFALTPGSAGFVSRSVHDGSAHELRDPGKCRLGGIEAESEVVIGKRGIEIRRLVPVRIPRAPI
jgi:hypothetical protein